MTTVDIEHIPAILDYYREHKADVLFDLSPYSTEPYWEGETVPTVLARQGLFAGTFHQMLYGVPTAEAPPMPEGVSIKEVGENEVADFMAAYEQVWGDAGAIKVLVGRPEFACYVAYVDGQAAALGVLHVANGAASMANALTVPRLRGRGCQTALLYRRIEEARRRGCDLIVSQCMPGSDSQKNQMKVGLRVAGTKAWWVPQQV
jgi:GNAT superfamily N-acetyltransferase